MANRAIVFVSTTLLGDILACRGRQFEPGVQLISDAPEDLKVVAVLNEVEWARNDRLAFVCESEEFPKVAPNERLPEQTITYHLEREEPPCSPVPE